MYYDLNLRRLILETVQDTSSYRVVFLKIERTDYVNMTDSKFLDRYSYDHYKRGNYYLVLGEPLRRRVVMSFLGLENWELNKNRQKIEQQEKRMMKEICNLLSNLDQSSSYESSTRSNFEVRPQSEVILS